MTDDPTESTRPRGAPEEFRDHWWWRPGWRRGRHFYACHVDFSDQNDFHRLASSYQSALGEFDNFDLIPRLWSHLTVQGVGFVDEVSADDLAAVEDRVRRRLASLPVPEVMFDRPTIVPEAIYFDAHPAAPLQEVWQATGDAIAEALGAGRKYELVEQSSGFRPHVSIAYSNAVAPSDLVVRALDSVNVPPATSRITHLHLMEFHRDDKMYCWQTIAAIPIGVASAV